MGTIMIGINQLPVFIDHLLEIIPGIPFQCRVPKQCRGVIDRHHQPILLFDPVAPDPCDAVIGTCHIPQCCSTQQDHDPGICQLQLLVQPRKAGGTLLWGGGRFPGGLQRTMFINIQSLHEPQCPDGNNVSPLASQSPGRPPQSVPPVHNGR